MTCIPAKYTYRHRTLCNHIPLGVEATDRSSEDPLKLREQLLVGVTLQGEDVGFRCNERYGIEIEVFILDTPYQGEVVGKPTDQLEAAVEQRKILTPDNPTRQAEVAALAVIPVTAFGYAEPYGRF